MLAISWQHWQNVGKFANALPMLPMFCQHLCKRRNYCSSKFPRIFSRLCNDSGPFSFTYSFPICQKYFFCITIQPTLVEYWLNIQRWSRGHKARGQGQGQGHKKNPRPRPRPRTAFSRTEPLEAKDRNARGQGQGPRTQAQVFFEKKVFKIFFRRSPIYWRTQNF